MDTSNALEDEVLAQYLLRSLPEQESERIDAMSITDDDVAWRIRAIENDLVDSYVRGELTGTRRTEFETVYLATPERRNRIARARALASAAHERTHSRSAWQKWAIAAALAIAIPSFWFLSTRDDGVVPEAPQPVPTVESAPAPAPPSVATPPATPAPMSVVSLLLPPPTRAARAQDVLSLPPDTGRAILRLQLEANDFPAYRGELRDLRRNAIVWRSESVRAAREDDIDLVSFELPPSILEQRNYSLELIGVPTNGRAELIASYTFSVEKR